MADSFHNMSASYMMKNRSAEFITMNEYVNTFSDKIAVLDRISQRIVKEQYGENNSLFSGGEACMSHTAVVFVVVLERAPSPHIHMCTCR